MLLRTTIDDKQCDFLDRKWETWDSNLVTAVIKETDMEVLYYMHSVNA